MFGDSKLPARFWSKVAETSDGCWTWKASRRNRGGYGSFRTGGRTSGRTLLAHRAAYIALVGPVPDGLELDHICRNRACVNPAHLEPVTHRENLARGAWASRTQCPKGHAYDEGNTSRRNGGRFCRECHREWNKNYYMRRMALKKKVEVSA